jgi:hypothetical protein
MEDFVAQGARIAGEAALAEEPGRPVADYAAAGFAAVALGDGPATERPLRAAEALAAAKTLNRAGGRFLDTLAGWASGGAWKDVVKQQAAAVRGVLKAAGPLADQTLFVCVGSSPDKLAMCLEHLGHAVTTVPFSRGFGRGREGGLAAATEGMKRDFAALVAAPLRDAFRRAGKPRVAVVDFVETGTSLLAWFELLRQTEPSVAGVATAIVISEERFVGEELGVQLLAIGAKAAFVEVDFNFWRFSKTTRCVPALRPSGPSELGALDVAVCNAARLFVALRVFKELDKKN